MLGKAQNCQQVEVEVLRSWKFHNSVLNMSNIRDSSVAMVISNYTLVHMIPTLVHMIPALDHMIPHWCTWSFGHMTYPQRSKLWCAEVYKDLTHSLQKDVPLFITGDIQNVPWQCIKRNMVLNNLIAYRPWGPSLLTPSPAHTGVGSTTNATHSAAMTMVVRASLESRALTSFSLSQLVLFGSPCVCVCVHA